MNARPSSSGIPWRPDYGDAERAAEQRRRREFTSDVRGANLHRESLEARDKRREGNIAEWTAWFRDQMAEHRCNDPVVLLPDALARLQEMQRDEVAAALSKLTTAPRKALS